MKPAANAINSVEWRDLVPLTWCERFWELTLPIPWLALSLYFYGRGWWWAGLPCSFYLFLTGLRESHNAQHCSLGVSRRAHDYVLFGLSVIMLASMHAVQTTHLHHHRHCLEDEDSEGATARTAWWKALLTGPLFACRLHRSAWKLTTKPRRAWILAELCAIAAVLVLGLTGHLWLGLHWHFATMVAGECFTGFFAVWTVHHGCGRGEPGRTQRGRWLNRLAYSMFFHAEHHLFPAVPTIHIAEVARRLDAAGTAFHIREVISFRKL